MKGTHIISDADPNKVVSQVEQFGANKTDFQAHYSTTLVPSGMNGGAVNFVAFTSALCIWETTPEDYRAWRQRFELSGGKIL